MTAILFGSISTLADTSEIQREAFNTAFADHGLDWRWDRDDYVAMLEKSGGADRVAEYARARGEEVDAAAVHQSKSKAFQKRLRADGVVARPGVVEVIEAAAGSGVKIGLVTTTSPANIAALLEALAPDITATDFAVIVDADTVDTPKPDGASYTYALENLGEDATSCVAIEDNVGGVAAAQAAGVTCVAFPNQNTAEHDFSDAATSVDRLDFAALQAQTEGDDD